MPMRARPAAIASHAPDRAPRITLACATTPGPRGPPTGHPARPRATLATPSALRRPAALAVRRPGIGLAIERAPKPPIGEVVQAYRHRIASLRRAEVDEDTARAQHDEIVEVLTALDDAFGL